MNNRLGVSDTDSLEADTIRPSEQNSLQLQHIRELGVGSLRLFLAILLVQKQPHKMRAAGLPTGKTDLEMLPLKTAGRRGSRLSEPGSSPTLSYQPL